LGTKKVQDTPRQLDCTQKKRKKPTSEGEGKMQGKKEWVKRRGSQLKSKKEKKIEHQRRKIMGVNWTSTQKGEPRLSHKQKKNTGEQAIAARVKILGKKKDSFNPGQGYQH